MSDARAIPYRRLMPVTMEVLGDREVRIRMSTPARARDGHILEPGGCVLGSYRDNPIVLWSHDPSCPIGNNDDVTVDASGISARTTFAPSNISVKADEICGLVKAGVIRAVSIGFDILEAEPIDPKRPKGGLRATKWELLECSFVSVPADTGAVVTERAIPSSKDTDGMADEATPRLAAARTRMISDTSAGMQRGLYDVAQLAYALSQLGYLKQSADWEAECEGDDSPVPAMLGEALVKIGSVLVAMTKEEVSEMLESTGTVALVEEDMLDGDERAYLRAAASPRLRAFRTAMLTVQRAGKTISAATAGKLGDVVKAHTDALGHAKAAVDWAATAAEHHDDAGAIQEKARAAHVKLGTAIEAMRSDPTADAADVVAKQHASVGKQIDALDAAHTDTGTAMDAGDDAVKAAAGSVRQAKRYVRSIMASAADDEDTTVVQTSAGTGDSDGTENDRAYSQARRLRALALLTLHRH